MTSDPGDLLTTLDAFARVDLGASPTPIEPLQRLGQRLGIELFVKRDDLFSLAMGGNKVRQLEYFLGPAMGMGADTVLVSGAIQSNMVRLTAAAARRLGWQAIVQLEDRVARDDHGFRHSGNVLLDRLFGAEIINVPSTWDEDRTTHNLDALANAARTKGRKPFVIQTGPDQPPLGSLGYCRAVAEVFDQTGDNGGTPDVIVIASGSGISHAGMLVGARAMGWDVPVHGVCVRRDAQAQRPRLALRLQQLAEMLQTDPIPDANILLNDADFLPGYGVMNDAVRSAIQHAALDEALILDPTYTGRAMAGLISLVASGDIPKGARVMFIHTGGQPGLFAYEQDLNARV